MKPNDLITATEAQKILRASPNKIAALIRDGVLQSHSDPLDKRVKLVSRTEVEKLLSRSRRAA